MRRLLISFCTRSALGYRMIFYTFSTSNQYKLFANKASWIYGSISNNTRSLLNHSNPKATIDTWTPFAFAGLFAFNANISCIRRPFKANPKWTRIFLRVEFHFTSNFILRRIQRWMFNCTYYIGFFVEFWINLQIKLIFLHILCGILLEKR